jgi:hypothetical protein
MYFKTIFDEDLLLLLLFLFSSFVEDFSVVFANSCELISVTEEVL